MVLLKTFIQRGNLTESIHEAKCLVKDSKYNILLSTKNDQNLVYPRSAIKIFQAVPFIVSKAHKKLGLNKKKIAISCASHCGEPQHLAILSSWINKIKLPIESLKCGIHNPINIVSSNNLLLSGNIPSQLHNNCAGKHLAMISGCIANKISFEDYVNYNHPYQKLIRDSLEYFMESSIQKKCIGTDGCGAPQYALTISSLADSMINLVKEKNNNNNFSDPINILLNAINKFPELIGGKNRFDSEIIKYTKGKIFCKMGAEGVLLFADIKKNTGGLIKIVDGNERAIPPLAMKIFIKLKLLSSDEKRNLIRWTEQILYNHAKKAVGKISAKIML